MAYPYYHGKIPKIVWQAKQEFFTDSFEAEPGPGHTAGTGRPYSIFFTEANFWRNYWDEVHIDAAGTLVKSGNVDPPGWGGVDDPGDRFGPGDNGTIVGPVAHSGTYGMSFSFDSASVAPGDFYIRRTYGGYTPGQVVTVHVWMKLNWSIFDPPYGGPGDTTTPAGIRIVGATTMTTYLPGPGWNKLTVSAPADGGGNIEIQLGGWGFIPGATQRIWSFDDLSLPAPTFLGPVRTLEFGYPVVNARSWPQPDAASASIEYDSGLVDAWVNRFDQMLAFDVISIPGVGGTGTSYGSTIPISGWDDAGGWREFLEFARQGGKFTFYPDRTDGGSAVDAYLVPSTGNIAPGVGWEQTRTMTLQLRRADNLRWTGF